MGVQGKALLQQNNQKQPYEERAICLHAFSNLSHTSPLVFLYLLKECYVYGTCKATKKFQALQQQVLHALQNSPKPGAATFIAQCLFLLPIFGLYSDGFGHLIISSLRRLLKTGASSLDLLKAKPLATNLFISGVRGLLDCEEKVLLKIVEAFDVRLTDIEETLSQSKAQKDWEFETGKVFVENYIYKLIESQSFMVAVSLLERFSIHHSGQSFLVKMLESKEYGAAEKWASFIGKPMLSILIQEYEDRNMLKKAFVTIKKNNLQHEFADLYHKCKESSIKKLAEKACWDVAEAKTKGNQQLIEYLVYLAMEAGYLEKVEELCERYSLDGFVKAKETEANFPHARFLSLDDLHVQETIWIDKVDVLDVATSLIEECKVVGVDCEWKPNYVKGSEPNKVSIMQIASDRMVFIFDLMKLYEDVRDALDKSLIRILQSSRVLKLGYNFQCDMTQLACSYGDLQCFKHYEMLLDIQNFKKHQGGLSGLAEKVLGVGLNKTRRNSNWEQRPLSQYQVNLQQREYNAWTLRSEAANEKAALLLWQALLEYAALDAAVLVHIFSHVHGPSPDGNASDGQKKLEWRSHIVSHMDNPKKRRNETKSNKTRSLDH